jgi:quercetin dioxygenase-like cupin family protein
MRALLRYVRFALVAGSDVTTLTVMGQPAPTSVTPVAKLGSTVFHWESLPTKPTGVGARRDVANQRTATLENLECHVSTLLPGRMSHPPHRHPQEEIIFIREGNLEININGRAQRVGPGSLFFFAANDLHNLTNVGDNPATYLVFQLTTAATHAAPAISAEHPGLLPSGVFDWEKLPVKATKTGARREVFDSPTLTFAHFECHVTTLNSGEVPHAPHRHPDEEIVIVKEGLLQVTVNGVTQPAGPDGIIFYGSNDEHGMKNVGPAPATYYVVRMVTAATPKPAT